MLHYEPGTDGIDAFIATSAAIALAIAGASAGGSIAAAKISSGANKDAAKMATDATTSAAQLQSQTADKTLAFQRQQAETDWRNAQQAQRANYDQWASGQGRLKSLAAMTGIDRGEPPPYVPGIDPRFDTSASQLPSTTTALPNTTTAAPGGDPISAALLKNYADLGVKPTGPGTGPTDIAYMAQRLNETGGLTPDNVKYWLGPQGRIADELAKAKGGAPTMAPASMATITGGVPVVATPTPILAPGAQGVQAYQPARRVFSFADLNGGQ